nr:FxsA family protein [Calditerricola satsumensis]
MALVRLLVLLFVLVPVIELWGLIQVGRWIGAWPTVLLVLATGLIGAYLARAQGGASGGGRRRSSRTASFPVRRFWTAWPCLLAACCS